MLKPYRKIKISYQGDETEKMTEPYRPSNGTESEFFFHEFCYQCARFGKDGNCEILGNSLQFEINDPNYPKQWVSDGFKGRGYVENPRCTAFIPEGEKVPEERCHLTKEMF